MDLVIRQRLKASNLFFSLIGERHFISASRLGLVHTIVFMPLQRPRTEILHSIRDHLLALRTDNPWLGRPIGETGRYPLGVIFRLALSRGLFELAPFDENAGPANMT